MKSQVWGSLTLAQLIRVGAAITWRGPPQRAELAYCHLLPNVTASTNVGRLAILYNYVSVFQSLEFFTILVHTCVLVLLTTFG